MDILKKINRVKPKKTINRLLTGSAVLVLMCITQINLQAQDGEKLFKQNCASCHSIGKGRMVGPDLQGVTHKRDMDWLLNFTKSSQTLIKSGDADAQAIYEEFNQIMMPDFNLSDDQIKAIFAYVESNSPAPKTEEPKAATEDKAEDIQIQDEEVDEDIITAENASQEDIEAGRLLFSGIRPFKNGGASCLSCHNVENDNVYPGGYMAKDLTEVYGRMGEAGIAGLLSSPPFPAMKVAYQDRELTEEEIFQLAAFFHMVDKEQLYQRPDKSQNMLVWGGLSGLVVILILIALIWMNRKKQMVKADIYKRQVRSR